MSDYAFKEYGLGFKIKVGSGEPVDPFWTECVVEPVKRNKDGWRYISHRFPIKGGITQAARMRLEWEDRAVAVLSQPMYLSMASK